MYKSIENFKIFKKFGTSGQILDKIRAQQCETF